MESLLRVLSLVYPLSPALSDSLKKCMTLLSLPKGFRLLESPRISDHAYFLEQGFAMSYTFSEGKKRVHRFWKEDQIIVSSKSFFEQVPSEEFIELMTQSDVWHISYANVMQLLRDHEEVRHIQQIIMNRYYEESNERVRLMSELTTQQHHEHLRKKFPLIEQYVPQEYIASYLGVAPQSLSRMKKRNRS